MSERDSVVTRTLLGLMALIGGVVVIAHPGGTLSAVTLVVGILLVIIGATDLAHGLLRAEERRDKVLRGVLLVAAGSVILAVPEMSGRTLATLVGSLLCLQGAVQIWSGFVLRAQRPATSTAA